jgi:hypothetical protein
VPIEIEETVERPVVERPAARIEKPMPDRKLQEKQELFLHYLFNEAAGNAYKAKIMAGYSATYPTGFIVKTLQEHILEATKRYLVEHGPKAVLSLVSVLDDPEQLGVAHKINVAKDVLDRIGVSKTEKIEMTPGVFIVPPKKEEEA